MIGKLTDSEVISLRKAAKEDVTFRSLPYSIKYKVCEETIDKAVRGETFKHLNSIESPITRGRRTEEKIKLAREMYKNGKTYNEIKVALKVSKTSLSRWCGDLVKETRDRTKKNIPLKPKIDKKARTASVIRFYLEGYRIYEICGFVSMGRSAILRITKTANLTEEDRQTREVNLKEREKVKPLAKETTSSRLKVKDVVELRKIAKSGNYTSFKDLGLKYGVSAEQIRNAIRGHSFKGVDIPEAPIEGDLRLRFKGSSKNDVLAKGYLDQMKQMRAEDPLKWSYGALATWLREKTKHNYIGAHVKVLLEETEPSEEVKKTPSFLYVNECVFCEKSFKTNHKSEEFCSRKCRKDFLEFAQERTEYESSL